MKAQAFKILIIFALVVALFLAGRWTAPKAVDTNAEVVKKLVQDTIRLVKQRDLAIDSMRHYHVMADTWFKIKTKKQEEKIITRTIYAQDTSRNRHYTVLQRDSVIRAELLH